MARYRVGRQLIKRNATLSRRPDRVAYGEKHDIIVGPKLEITVEVWTYVSYISPSTSINRIPGGPLYCCLAYEQIKEYKKNI